MHEPGKPHGVASGPRGFARLILLFASLVPGMSLPASWADGLRPVFAEILGPPPGTPAAGSGVPPFRKVQLSEEYYSEGAAFGDFNRDGQPDVVSGAFWYEGPDFRRKHAFAPAAGTPS